MTRSPKPPAPQREGWDAIASGRDTLIVAPTGSGKTLAAFLWAIDHLCRLALDRQLEDRVYVVYVSPLRALNNDIEKNLRAPLAGIRAAAAADGLALPEIRVAVRTGDTLAAQRQAMTRRPPHVLITTPGVAVHPAHERAVPSGARPHALPDRRRDPRADGLQARRPPGAVARTPAGAGSRTATPRAVRSGSAARRR